MASLHEPDGRARLVAALLSCLSDYGYQGTTLRRVAERAQVTAGLVRHHFDGKDALFCEAYRQINQQALDRMAAALKSDAAGSKADLGSQLEAAIRSFFPDDLSDARQMRIMVAFWGLVMTHPEIAEIQKATYTAFQNHFITIIKQHLGGQASAGAEREEIANGIIAIADGLWLECCLNPDRMTAERAIATATAFARARLGC